jgi:hypothetical protein
MMDLAMPESRKKQSPKGDRSDPAAKRAAIRAGIEAADKGNTVPHDKVRRWLLSWGTEKELPPPKCK